MNVFTFSGNLGKDCEIKTTQSGATVCSFSVAVKSGFGDKAKTTWVRCSMFGKRAEGQLPQYLTKGQGVAISGEACLEEWNGNDGQVNKMLTVFVDKLDLIGDKRDQTPQQGYQQQTPQQAPIQQGGFAPQQQQPTNQGGFAPTGGYPQDNQPPF